MKSKTIFQFSAVIFSMLFFTACKKNNESHFCDADDVVVSSTKVFAKGLNNPRGIKFGPDGKLYVAEGGIGGTNSSFKCMQVPSPVGPYTGSVGGSRISRIDDNGMRTTWVEHLPSSKNAMGEISGVGDVAFIGTTLYAVITGAGCSHGVPTIPNGVIKINANRSWSMITDLSQFLMTHPVKHPEPDDFEPDGDWYSMNNVDGDLFAIEANHGELDRISTNGHITRVIDFSAHFGHIVPTAQAYYKGNFYVGNLDTFPAPHGGSKIYKVTPSGQVSVFADGFNMILGVVFDNKGGMYVLEMTTNNPFPTPGTGDIVRVSPSGFKMGIVSGLNFPTAMTFGPDGKLYVSVWGFGMPPGGGQILQVNFKCNEIRGNNGY